MTSKTLAQGRQRLGFEKLDPKRGKIFIIHGFYIITHFSIGITHLLGCQRFFFFSNWIWAKSGSHICALSHVKIAMVRFTVRWRSFREWLVYDKTYVQDRVGR